MSLGVVLLVSGQVPSTTFGYVSKLGKTENANTSKLSNWSIFILTTISEFSDISIFGHPRPKPISWLKSSMKLTSQSHPSMVYNIVHASDPGKSLENPEQKMLVVGRICNLWCWKTWISKIVGVLCLVVLTFFFLASQVFFKTWSPNLSFPKKGENFDETLRVPNILHNLWSITNAGVLARSQVQTLRFAQIKNLKSTRNGYKGRTEQG